jgi:hypothetical protein
MVSIGAPLGILIESLKPAVTRETRSRCTAYVGNARMVRLADTQPSAQSDAKAWLQRARNADEIDEKLLFLSRAHEVEPFNEDGQAAVFSALKEHLQRRPYLAYYTETNSVYRVLTARKRSLFIPKLRSAVEKFPRRRANRLASAQRWLALSVAGLLFAGVGTLVFAPLAAFAALNVRGTKMTPREHIRSSVILALSVASFILGLGFSALLALHWY